MQRTTRNGQSLTMHFSRTAASLLVTRLSSIIKLLGLCKLTINHVINRWKISEIKISILKCQLKSFHNQQTINCNISSM